MACLAALEAYVQITHAHHFQQPEQNETVTDASHRRSSVVTQVQNSAFTSLTQTEQQDAASQEHKTEKEFRTPPVRIKPEEKGVGKGHASNLRGGQERAFFVYDHRKHAENFDPKDAILYFYPPSMDIGDQIALVGGIIGTLDFCIEVLQTTPALVTLTTCKFALLKSSTFVLGLSADLHVPEQVVKDHLQLLWRMFCLFQGSFQLVRQRSGVDGFGLELHRIWDSYFSRCQGICDQLSEAFGALPYRQLSPFHSGVFLEASHILQRAQHQAGIIGGVLLNKNKILCTQLSSGLTRLLVLMPQNNSFPSIEIKPAFDLPAGVRLLCVFLSAEELSILGPRKRLDDPYKTQHTSSTLSSEPSPVNPTAAFAELAAFPPQHQTIIKSASSLSAVVEAAEALEAEGGAGEVFLDAVQTEAALPGRQEVAVTADVHGSRKDEDTGEAVESQPSLSDSGDLGGESASGDGWTQNRTPKSPSEKVRQQSEKGHSVMNERSVNRRTTTGSERLNSDSSQAVCLVDRDGEDKHAGDGDSNIDSTDFTAGDGDSNRDSTDFTSADDGDAESAEAVMTFSENFSQSFDNSQSLLEENGLLISKSTKQPDRVLTTTTISLVPEERERDCIVSENRSTSLSFPLQNSVCDKETAVLTEGRTDLVKETSDASRSLSWTLLNEHNTERRKNGVSDGGGETLCNQKAIVTVSAVTAETSLDQSQSGLSEKVVVLRDGNSQCSLDGNLFVATTLGVAEDMVAEEGSLVMSDGIVVEDPVVSRDIVVEDPVVSRDIVVEDPMVSRGVSAQLSECSDDDSTLVNSILNSSVSPEPHSVDVPSGQTPSSSAPVPPKSLALYDSNQSSLLQDRLYPDGDCVSSPEPQVVHFDSQTTVIGQEEVTKTVRAAANEREADPVSVTLKPVAQEEGSVDTGGLENGRQSCYDVEGKIVVQPCSPDGEMNHGLITSGAGSALSASDDLLNPDKERLNFEPILLNSGSSRSGGPAHELTTSVAVASVSEPRRRYSTEPSSSDVGHSTNEALSPLQSSSSATDLSSNRSLSSEHDGAMGGKKKMALYVQGHMDTLLVLLIDNLALVTRETVNILWKSSLAKLAELDFAVSDANGTDEEDAESSKSPYLFLKYSSASHAMQGNAQAPVTSLANELVASSILLHDTFARMPGVTDILCRTHTTCCYGHKTMGNETYFQTATPKGGGLLDPRDSAFSLDQAADRRLYIDHHSALL